MEGLIIKSFQSLVAKLAQVFYVVVLPGGVEQEPVLSYANTQVKNILGVSQYELFKEPDLLFNAVHPDDKDMYHQTTKELLSGPGNMVRSYKLKNHISGEYEPIEEFLQSYFSPEHNSYKLYCCVKQGPGLDITISSDEKLQGLGKAYMETINEMVPIKTARLYICDPKTHELTLAYQHLTKESLKRLERLIGTDPKKLVPSYKTDNVYHKLISTKEPYFTNSRRDVKDIIKDHTSDSYLRTLAMPVTLLLNISAFGQLPVISKENEVIASIGLARESAFNDNERKTLSEFVKISSPLIECCIADALSPKFTFSKS